MTEPQAFIGRIRAADWYKVLASPWSVVLVVLVSAILFALMMPAIQVGTWNDDATYITMARSLLEGKGLSLTYLPTDPVYPVVPVGYPLALAPLVYLFPNSFLPLKLLSGVLLLAGVFLVYKHAQPRMGHTSALLVAALFGTNVAIVQSAAQVMSEAPFILSLLVAVVQTDRYVKVERPGGHEVVFTGVLLTLPLTVRYLGLPIVAALVAYILWRRRDRFALAALGVGLISWALLNIGLGGWAVAQYYFDRISGLARRLPLIGVPATLAGTVPTNAARQGWLAQFIANVRFLLTDSLPGVMVPLFHGPRVRSLFSQWGLGFVPDLMQLTIDALLLGGFVWQVRRKAGAAEWAMVAYVATLFLLPTDWTAVASRFRYWIPVIPFGYCYLVGALRAAHRWILTRFRPPGFLDRPDSLAALVVACLLVLNVGRNVQEAVLNPLRGRTPDLSIGSTWINTHSAPDDVVMVELPRVAALYIRREVVSYNFSSWESRQTYKDLRGWHSNLSFEAKMDRAIDAFSVDYILVSPALVPDQPLHWSDVVQDDLLPLMASRSHRLTLCQSYDDLYVRIYCVPRELSELE